MTDYDLDEVVAVSRGDLKNLAGWDEHLMLDSTQEKAIPVSDDYDRLLAAIERHGHLTITYNPPREHLRLPNVNANITVGFGTTLCVYEDIGIGDIEGAMKVALDSLDRLKKVGIT